ncbi:hypothetical protein E2C01_067046 [Portunus trituberculatus]|uniref:Uncharacterized protein n=1 Tax=Portunus trituberculatus TaxID=210409 RepID=A0A5B7HWF9_PORTR|nr:hypothetical protein [Portunus trituberculatus]
MGETRGEVDQSKKSGFSPGTLGEGLARGDKQHLASYPSPQDGILPPPPPQWAAISVLSANRGPVSCNFPMAQDDHQALIESPCPSCYGWQGSGAPLSSGLDSALLASEKQDWLPKGLESGEGIESPRHATSLYHHMMSCITSVFEDAVSQRIDFEHPVALGTDFSSA